MMQLEISIDRNSLIDSRLDLFKVNLGNGFLQELITYMPCFNCSIRTAQVATSKTSLSNPLTSGPGGNEVSHFNANISNVTTYTGIRCSFSTLE